MVRQNSTYENSTLFNTIDKYYRLRGIVNANAQSTLRVTDIKSVKLAINSESLRRLQELPLIYGEQLK